MGKKFTSVELELMCVGSENNFSPIKEMDLNFLQESSQLRSLSLSQPMEEDTPLNIIDELKDETTKNILETEDLEF